MHPGAGPRRGRARVNKFAQTTAVTRGADIASATSSQPGAWSGCEAYARSPSPVRSLGEAGLATGRGRDAGVAELLDPQALVCQGKHRMRASYLAMTEAGHRRRNGRIRPRTLDGSGLDAGGNRPDDGEGPASPTTARPTDTPTDRKPGKDRGVLRTDTLTWFRSSDRGQPRDAALARS